MYFLGVIYLDGTIATKGASEIGLNWIQRAAESGNRRALLTLAGWYAQGEDSPFPLDYSKAFQLYQRATKAEPGCSQDSNSELSQSYCTLGVLYLQGLGVEKDSMKAFESYQKAADLVRRISCSWSPS